jgi:hypothetical protein
MGSGNRSAVGMTATFVGATGMVPGAAWWPHMAQVFRAIHGGTYLVTVGNYAPSDANQRFMNNVGAVVDDFGDLVPVRGVLQ